MEIQTIRTGLKWNTLSALLQSLLKVFRGLLIPKLLPNIAEYGLFTSVNLYTRYLNFSDLGSKEYMLKHLPPLYLKRKVEEENKLINETVTVQFITFSLVTIYLIISSRIYYGENRDFYRVALILLIPSVFLVRGKDILSIIANSRLQYKDVARTQMLWDLSSFLLTVAGVVVGGALGGIVAMVCANMIAFLYIYCRINITYEFTFSWLNKARLKEYWSLFSVYALELISNSYDLMLLMLLFSAEQYGLYSLGLVSVWVMVAIGGVLQSTIQPKIMSLGTHENQNVLDIFVSSILLLLGIALIVAPFLVFILKLIVTFYLTDYSDGHNVYIVLTFLGIFRSLNIVLKLFFIAQNRERRYRNIILSSFVFLGLLFLLFFIMDFSLLKVVIFFFFYDFLLFVRLTRNLYGASLLKNYKIIGFTVVVAICYMVGILSISYSIIKVDFVYYLALTIILYFYVGKLYYNNKNRVSVFFKK